MKTLKIDDKWSVEYDPENNDVPHMVRLNGSRMPERVDDWTHDVHAMFYALLEARRMQETVALVLPEMTPEQMEELRMLGQRTGGLVEVDMIPGKRKALDEVGDVIDPRTIIHECMTNKEWGHGLDKSQVPLQLEGYRSDDFVDMSTQQTDALIGNWVKWGIGNNRCIAAFLNALADHIKVQ